MQCGVDHNLCIRLAMRSVSDPLNILDAGHREWDMKRAFEKKNVVPGVHGLHSLLASPKANIKVTCLGSFFSMCSIFRGGERKKQPPRIVVFYAPV